MGNLDYNGEIAVDSHKRIILASYITIQSNRPLRTCSINGTSTIKFNRNITMKMPVNYQVSADNGYSTDENTEYLEKTWTLTVTYPHKNSFFPVFDNQKVSTLTVTYPHKNSQEKKKIVNNCPKKKPFFQR